MRRRPELQHFKKKKVDPMFGDLSQSQSTMLPHEASVMSASTEESNQSSIMPKSLSPTAFTRY